MKKGKFSGTQFFSSEITPEEYVNQAINGDCHAARTLSHMLRFLSFPSRELFIELGCGPGESLEYFIELGHSFEKYAVVDASRDMTVYTQTKYQKLGYNVVPIVADLEKDMIPLHSESADVIACTSTACYIQDLRMLFGEAYRMLKPGGYFGFDVLAVSEETIANGFSYATGHDVTCFCHSAQESIYKLSDTFVLQDKRILEVGCIDNKYGTADYISYLFQKK